MKQHHLSSRFLTFYICIGIFGFFLITLGGSYMVEKYFESAQSTTLYEDVCSIASSDLLKEQLSDPEGSHILEEISGFTELHDSVLWITDTQGQLVFSSSLGVEPGDSILPENFTASAWSPSHYQIGRFYDHFSCDHLSVLTPVTSDQGVLGYVTMHYDMHDLYNHRSSILFIMQVIFLICYAATSFLLWVYSHYIRRPLTKIIKGASEYASGNLEYMIEVNSDDELGYLAKTLNYMADKLNQNGEYQRKFIANVSHDFRSPLTSIKGYVTAMLDGTIPVEMQERYLKIIAFESERLEKLTRSLLTLNELDIKKRMMHLHRFNINDTITQTAATFEGICSSRQIRLELLLSGHELYVRADMEQIQQVLYNLLDNAIKFSEDNSSIQIETSVKNDKAFVSVKDHGTGIPKDSLPKIWDRFYKIDASRGKDRKGTGLGLAIVKEIVNAHNQHIDVVSTEGVGTEFIFTLEKCK